jgi:hypothetical protein
MLSFDMDQPAEAIELFNFTRPYITFRRGPNHYRQGWVERKINEVEG